MKFILSIFLSFISLNALVAQDFEGKIIYENTYSSNTDGVSSQQWSEMLGSKQEYFYKEGSYKSGTNGSLVQWQLYVNSDNKLYTKTANSETLYWNDAAENKDTVLKIELNKKVVEVLGYLCDELILTCGSGVQKYYFNSRFTVDPTLFKNHRFGNWSTYLKNSKALPLKMIIETPQFRLESTAVIVRPIKLDSKFLELAPGVVVEKSPM